MSRILTLSLAFVLASCNLFLQTTLKQDTRTEQLITQGKRFLRNESYNEAWDSFELARERDFNRSTTAAIYLSGLTAYYLDYGDIASQRFNTIIREYPKSMYVEDAKYHLALLNLFNGKTDQIQLDALDQLLSLSDQASNGRLGKDALDKAKAELFEKRSSPFIAKYVSRVAPKHKQWVMEALLYQEIQEGQTEKAKQRYEMFLNSGGRKSDYLKQLFPDKKEKEMRPTFEPNIIRLAIFLPLYLNQAGIPYLDKIPQESQRALEFYEGFKMAVDKYKENSSKNIFLKIYDTQRDTTITSLYMNQLDSLGPNVVVGEIYNNQSHIISRWAEEKKVPQIVPISPSEELVEDKLFTFLAHPTAYTHGAVMANYAFNNLNHRRAYVFTDRTSSTDMLASGFSERFTLLGGQVDTLSFTYNRKIDTDIVDEIKDLVDRVEDSTAVYIPLMGNEESASLIINLMKRENKMVTVMGSPHFRSRYNTLSREIKEDYKMLFTTSHLHDPEDQAFKEVYNDYLKNYEVPPSDNVIQGYDLAMYILRMLDNFNPQLGMSLDQYLRFAPKYKSLHLDYGFDSTQSNQQVNIGQYTDEGVIKVN